ncbi:MAG: sigma-70 family RNA polymerase sigma factor [Proteobacteria bacterium]|nr:sigma-70 family RNA polymerase sigma factor [Pseudomonadota bacterium]MBU1641700.1 sigma-70 family RNA polymerase sigma factor [Pseudomonadota bacterium]
MSNTHREKLKEHLPLVDRLAVRRFTDPVLADEAVVYVLGKLQDTGGKHLDGFSGRSRFSTYLGSVVRRLFEDFSRAKFGRLRPPAWIAKLGGWWLLLYRLLCMERLSVVEALATMENHQGAGRFDAEEAASRILSEVTDCGKMRGDEQLTADGEIDHLADGGAAYNSDTSLEKRERDNLFAVIFQELLGGDTTSSVCKDSFHKILDVAIVMTSQERLLLKLCFQDDLSVTEAARWLDISVHQAHGRMRRLLQRLKEDFAKAGLADELVLLLQQDDE